MTDISVNNCGSILMVTPVTQAATDWFLGNMPDDTMMLGPAYAIEPRYFPPIIDALIEEGFTV